MWCDDTFGWGPFVDSTNVLTLCFCVTVFEMPQPIILSLFGVPALCSLSNKPFVNPASSVTFSLKVCLSAVVLFCALLLALFEEPSSMANTWAQSLTAAGWLLSILMLVAGYLRAQPQLGVLRVWWIFQFLSGCIVFGNHSIPHGVYIVRGISLVCIALLIPLSLFRYDVPTYEAIMTTPSFLRSPSPPVFQTASQHQDNSSGSDMGHGMSNFEQSASRPLLSAENGSTESLGFGLPSHLSQMTLYGAEQSAFQGAISAWDRVVSQRLQPCTELHLDEDIAEYADESA